MAKARATAGSVHLPEAALQAAWAALAGTEATLTTAEGEALRVVFPGVPNRGAGPDCQGAIIATERGRLVRGGVERAGHDVIDRGRRQTGDLGPQFVADAGARSSDLGVGACLEVGDLGGQARTALGEHCRSLLLGLGHDATALAVDVTLIVPDGPDRKKADWDYTHEPWQRLVKAIRAHPRLHSLANIGDWDHIEAVQWRKIAAGPVPPTHA